MSNNELSNIFSPEMLKELEKHSEAVRSGLGKVNTDIEKVAFNLYWIYENKAYKAMGHESIIDYAQHEFDIAKSSTYNFINIVEYFGARDKNGNLTLKGFDAKYKDFSYSKLVMLTSVQKDEINLLSVTPDMSVREIKKYIKDNMFTGYLTDTSLKPVSRPASDDSSLSKHLQVLSKLIEYGKDKEASSPDIQESDSSDDVNDATLYDDNITLRDFINGLIPELYDRFKGSIDLFFSVHPNIDPEDVYVEINIVSK